MTPFDVTLRLFHSNKFISFPILETMGSGEALTIMQLDAINEWSAERTGKVFINISTLINIYDLTFFDDDEVEAIVSWSRGPPTRLH